MKISDQELANIRDSIPPMWMAIYNGCLAVGFDEKQSFVLTQTHIIASSSSGGCRPPDGYGPKEDA